jgi:Zn-dependent protease with chaperone function
MLLNQLEPMVKELSGEIGVKIPKIRVIDNKQFNAEASLFGHIIGVMELLLTVLSKDEMRVVVAHELGHIKHRLGLRLFYSLLLFLLTVSIYSGYLGSNLCGWLLFSLVSICIYLPKKLMLRAELNADMVASSVCGLPRTMEVLELIRGINANPMQRRVCKLR